MSQALSDLSTMTINISVALIDPTSDPGPDQISELKIVFASILPVSYPPSFYRDLRNGKMRGFLAKSQQGRVLGGLVVRVEEGGTHIMALAVLSGYRRQGVGRQLLIRALGQEET